MAEFEKPRMRWNTGTMQYEPVIESEGDEKPPQKGMGWYVVAIIILLLVLLVLVLLTHI